MSIVNRTIHTTIQPKFTVESWGDEDFGIDIDDDIIKYIPLDSAVLLRDALTAHIARFT